MCVCVCVCVLPKKYAYTWKIILVAFFCQDNMDLLCDNMGSYLVIWAIDLECEGVSAVKVERTVVTLK